MNNNRPTPRPTTEQTLNGGRPLPSFPTTGTPITIPGAGRAPVTAYVPVEAAPAYGVCDTHCQIVGFGDGLFGGIQQAVVGTVGIVVDTAQCSPMWVSIDAVPCAENAVAITQAVDYAVEDPGGFAKGI